MYKVLFITCVPSPSRVDFFNILGSHPNVDLTVIFLESEKEQHHRSQKWFAENTFENFKYFYLNKRVGFKNKQYYGYISVDILHYLKDKYDEVIFAGYAYPTFMFGMQNLIVRKVPYSIEVDGGFAANENYLKKKLKSHFISHACRWYSSGKGTDEYLKFYGAREDGIVHYPFTSLAVSDFCRAWNCSKEEFTKLLEGLDTDNTTIIEKRNELRKVGKEHLGITHDKNILTIGQFIHRKGFDLLLKAACSLDKNIGVTIVGGKAPQTLIDFVNENHLTNISFVDFQSKEELKYYYWMADLFVMPTREDIWGLVINEAMAYGLPVISTDKCLAALELIEEPRNGYIIPVESIEDLQNSIINFFLEERQFMEVESLKIIKDYTIEDMANRHVKLWEGKPDADN